jgi:hypothetical protein
MKGFRRMTKRGTRATSLERGELTLKEVLSVLFFPCMLLGYAILCLVYAPYALTCDFLEEIKRALKRRDEPHDDR